MENNMASKKNENIYIITGDDITLVKEEIKKLEKIFSKKNSIDKLSYFAEETETFEIISNCNSFSVFTDYVLIKLFDFHKANLELISTYVDNPNPKTILLLISYKSLKDLGKSKALNHIKSKAKVVDIKPLYENQIKNKIIDNLNKCNLRFTGDVVDYIAQQVGNVNSGISNFFQVIKESGIKDTITLGNVKEFETITAEKNLFSFLDYFIEKNIISSMNSYKSLVSEGTPLIVINRTIFNRMNLYINYLSLKEDAKTQSEIMQELKINNQWYFNKIRGEASKFNYKIMRFILEKCYEIDKAIKSEVEEEINTRFELFLMDLKKDWLNV